MRNWHPKSALSLRLSGTLPPKFGCEAGRGKACCRTKGLPHGKRESIFASLASFSARLSVSISCRTMEFSSVRLFGCLRIGFRDEPGYFGVRSHRLDHDYMPSIEEGFGRTMKLLTTFD
jgi:hypothetical protein